MSRLMLLLCQLAVAVVVVGFWQLLASVPVFGHVLLPPFFFSNPVDVAAQIVDWFVTGVIWKHLLITSSRVIPACSADGSRSVAISVKV